MQQGNLKNIFGRPKEYFLIDFSQKINKKYLDLGGSKFVQGKSLLSPNFFVVDPKLTRLQHLPKLFKFDFYVCVLFTQYIYIFAHLWMFMFECLYFIPLKKQMVLSRHSLRGNPEAQRRETLRTYERGRYYNNILYIILYNIMYNNLYNILQSNFENMREIL